MNSLDTGPNDPAASPAASLGIFDWGTRLHIVFSVLIGVSFAAALTNLGQSNFEYAQLLMVTTVFYVVLDCWFNLNKEVAHLNSELCDHAGGWYVGLFLLTLVSYSCLPFLYFARNASPAFEAPEFLIANLALVCILDATRRSVAFVKDGNGNTAEEEKWHDKNAYLFQTGYLFGLFLVLGTLAFTASHLSTTWKAAIILVAWLGFRAIDYVWIARIIKRRATPPARRVT